MGEWSNGCPEVFERQSDVLLCYFVLLLQKYSAATSVCRGCCISRGVLPQWPSLKLMFLMFTKLPFPEVLVLPYNLNETMTLSGSSITIAGKINCSAQKTELMVQRLPSTARCLFAAESWRESKQTRQMGRKLSWLMFMFPIYKKRDLRFTSWPF